MDLLRSSRALWSCVCARGVLTHHHVSVILSCRSGKVLCFACNYAVGRQRSVHAERAVLDRFDRLRRARRLSARELSHGVELVSLRVARDEKHLLNAQPCAVCQALIDRRTIVKVVAWSTSDQSVHRRHQRL